MNRRKTLQHVLVFTNALFASTGLIYSPTASAEYPEKTVRLIVGTPPGDSPDISARLFANTLSNQMGQSVLVDNRPGASQTIAFNMVAKAPPDGYTIGWGTFLLATSPILIPKLPYDPVKDLQMVMQAVYTPNLMAVTPSLPVKSVADLINYAKQNPGRVSFGSVGSGSSLHLGMELFKIMTGTQMMHVPYKGAQLAIADVISGEVHVICDNIASIIPYIQSNRLRGLAVTGPKRSPMVAGLPTMSEAGVPGFIITPFGGPIAPAGIPRQLLLRLNTEFNVALESPKIKEFYGSLGIERVGGTPEHFAQLVKNEVAKWADVVKRTGAKLD
jgi:tripartite-type tricarboxylate transporter receptor subunit TctC